MNKRSLPLILAALIVLLVGPSLALAQTNPLVCDDFTTSPDDIRVGYYMGEGAGFFVSGQYYSALDSFSCIIQQIDPSYVNAHTSRAATYVELRNYDLALADYTRAIELSPSLVAAYNNRGIVYAAQAEYELALADFGHALNLDGGYILALNNRGAIRALQGDYSAAIADFEQAINVSGIDDILAQVTDPNWPANQPWPAYDRDHAQAYAMLGIVYSAQALDNFRDYLTLTGSAGDARIQDLAGSLESRFSFELRLDDGTWLLEAGFVPLASGSAPAQDGGAAPVPAGATPAPSMTPVLEMPTPTMAP